MRPSAAPPKGRQLQYELGESINAEPIGADNYVRRGAEFVVAVRADAGPGYFSARRYKRLRRWRNRAPLRDRDGFWQIDGPAGGQNHGRSGFYFAGTAEGSSSLGGDDSGRARFSNHWPPDDGKRERKGFAGRNARQAKNFLAGGDGNLLSGVAFTSRAALRE